jgi:hypothetical protein
VKLKRPDLLAFAAVMLSPLLALSILFALRARRIPRLAAELPARAERLLTPVVRPSHAAGSGVFGKPEFAEMIALGNLAAGEPDYTVLAAGQRESIERVLRASHAPSVDAPDSWRLVLIDPNGPVIKGLAFARLSAARAAASASSEEAVDTCVDAAGVARDLSYWAGILGMSVREVMLEALEPPCVRVLRNAPAGLRSRALDQLQRIAAAERTWPEVMQDEGLGMELLIIQGRLPKRWLARFPAPVRDRLSQPRDDSIWRSATVLDSLPDLHQAYADLSASAILPDRGVRKAGYGRVIKKWQGSINPLVGIALPDYGKLDDKNQAAHDSLQRLVEAAR